MNVTYTILNTNIYNNTTSKEQSNLSYESRGYINVSKRKQNWENNNIHGSLRQRLVNTADLTVYLLDGAQKR